MHKSFRFFICVGYNSTINIFTIKITNQVLSKLKNLNFKMGLLNSGEQFFLGSSYSLTIVT